MQVYFAIMIEKSNNKSFTPIEIDLANLFGYKRKLYIARWANQK